MLPRDSDPSVCSFGLCGFFHFRLIQLREDTSDWLPPVPDDVSPASFTHLRQGLQRHIIQRILAPKFGKNANLEDSSPELEAVMQVVG